jgi:hypothetical protein
MNHTIEIGEKLGGRKRAKLEWSAALLVSAPFEFRASLSFLRDIISAAIILISAERQDP